MPTTDDLDLSHLLRPAPTPPDGAMRARQTAHRRRRTRRVAASTVALALGVAALTTAIAWPGGDHEQVVAGHGEAQHRLLVITRVVSGVDAVRFVAAAIDVEGGAVQPRELPADGAEVAQEGALSRTGGVVVVLGRAGDHDVWALPAPGLDPPRHLGRAHRVVASAHDDRVWLVLDEHPGGDELTGHTAAVVEVDLDGRRTSPRRLVPCCWTLVGDAGAGLVLASGTTLQVWDAEQGEATARFGDAPELVAVGAGRAFYTGRDGCDPHAERATVVLLDLATGERRPLGEPCAYTAGDGLGPTGLFGGELSPDGGVLATWRPRDGAGRSLELLPVDGGEPVSVPESANAEYLVAWDARGRVYHPDGSARDVVRYDPATGVSRVVARAHEGGLLHALAVAR